MSGDYFINCKKKLTLMRNLPLNILLIFSLIHLYKLNAGKLISRVLKIFIKNRVN